ncbi:MAG: lytic transglycosylase domain-containing protein, partial [Lachnoclostridium sp.]|nr:lytic transglycosylase domain-containing protein [Lachnoclostridium sp.]
MLQSVSDVTITNNLGGSVIRTGKTTITPFRKVFEESVSSVSQNKVSGEVSSAYGEESTLESIFREAAAKHNISYELLTAVAKAESNFNPESTSGKGAQGIMQLMPATAKDLGVTDSYDVRQNIMAGAKYLASHLKAFDGNVDYAIAAYNAGGSAVREYGGIPP